MAGLPDRFKAIELETSRFRLVPIRPMSLVLPTLHWTEESEMLANVGWRLSGWTPRRWWRHLRHQVHGNRRCHGIWPKSGGACIGLHLMNVSAGAQSALIGVFIGERDWWGRAVVSEVRETIIDDCFERMALERLWAQVNARNFPSVYNHRKLGFVHEGTLRSHVDTGDGTRMDLLMFGMLRSEWSARREQAGSDAD